MCLKAIDWLDAICCSRRDKSILLAGFSLAHAIVFFFMTIQYSDRTSQMGKQINYLTLFIVVLCFLLTLLGTICLLVGIYATKGVFLLVGIILTTIAAIAHFYTIYYPVIQFFCVISAWRYFQDIKGE